MIKRLLVVVCTLIMFFGLLPVSAQKIDSLMADFAENYPNQKIHVHFDKDIFRAGETMWFKGYIFSGIGQSTKSTNFYAELLDKNGVVVQRKTYPIFESCAPGNFDLSETFPAGKYLFRSYTTWMLNFDTSFIYEKVITVINSKGIADNVKQQPSPATYSLQFFPEGGDLVNTLESVVAFKATDNAGIPLNVNGRIVNSKGKGVATFKSVHDGMGRFELTPEGGETYTAIWKNPEAKEERTVLPVAKNGGVVLKINPARDKKFFVINRTAEVGENLKQLNVVAQFAQQMVYKARVPLDNLMNSGFIPTNDFPSGVMQVTVFTKNWEPLAERIVMINNDDYSFNVSISAPLVDMNKRAKNEIQVHMDDSLFANMSIAITDADVVAGNYSDNIISRMLLTGDIRGYVHNPAYYFSNITDSVTNNLDLVMLTHGWRKYNWNEVLTGVKPELKFPAESYLSISAKAFGTSNKNEIKEDEMLMAIITSKDSSKQFLQLPYVGNNEFAIKNLIFFDSVYAHYSFIKNKSLDRKASVAFNNSLYTGSKRISLRAPIYADGTDTATLNRNLFLARQISKFGSSWKAEGNVLEAVTVRTKVKSRLEELNERYTSGFFKDDNGFSFDFTDDKNTYPTDIFTFLQGRVPGLQISNSAGNVSVQWRNSPTSFYLNEMNVEAQTIQGINVMDIALVKVYRPPFFGSFGGGAGGAIAIYTKRGGDAQSTPGPGLNKAVIKGYSMAKQFYSPDYSTRAASTDVVADYRSTLYWNPLILTDASQKKIRVPFFNNDVTKAFRVVLEGVNEEGKLIRIEKVFQ
ncbi:MAG: hypothetical protein JWQ96_1959 [Segetibacter sp.]|nr:hypothetical protein [Segetibacter sp.]